MKFRQALMLLGVITMPTLSAELPDIVASPHRAAIQSWLNRHPGYRLAVLEDCHCTSEVESIRRGAGGPWRADLSYQPYAAVGDFDGDGLQDLAVVALPERPNDGIIIVVSFAERAAPDRDTVEILCAVPNVVDRGLFVRSYDPKLAKRRSKLLFGTFESEADELPIKRTTSPVKSNTEH
jgi:hypothetical protein